MRHPQSSRDWTGLHVLVHAPDVLDFIPPSVHACSSVLGTRHILSVTFAGSAEDVSQDRNLNARVRSLDSVGATDRRRVTRVYNLDTPRTSPLFFAA